MTSSAAHQHIQRESRFVFWVGRVLACMALAVILAGVARHVRAQAGSDQLFVPDSILASQEVDTFASTPEASLESDPLMSGQAQGEWRITIHEAAVVNGPVVLLGEIAEPLGEYPADLWAELAGTPLWESPALGERPMSITGIRLAAALHHYMNEYADICLTPDSVTLQRGGTLYTESELAAMAARAINQNLAGWAAQGAEAELREYQVPSHIFVADATSSLEVELSNDVEAGRNSFKYLEIGIDGEVQRRVSGSVFVDIWVQVPAAEHPLNRGDTLTVADVTFVRKNLAYLRDDIWDGTGGPFRVRSSVGEGQPIYESHLEILPVVQEGDTVTLVWQGQNIFLSVPAEALADGGAGETITVRNLQSDQEVLARVKDSQTVEVF
ncbi:MAG: flagella basal body P-ring formation protein FlgA [Desulfovibrio sp.]|nr:MAG: flagella basal body P-ring formation protein FlgA [Desulfovibrio sp.]